MFTSDERMDVIGHRAVRNNRELVSAGRVRQLRNHFARDRIRSEDPGAAECTDRQEISLGTEVVESVETAWTHAM